MAPTGTLTQEQQDNIVALIREYAEPALGPAITERVKQALGERTDSDRRDWIAAMQEASRPPQDRDTGKMFGQLVRALAAGKGDVERAVRFAEKVWNLDENDPVMKTLTAADPTGGGFIVPEEVSTEIIELLRPRSVVRAMGARTIDMDSGVLRLPKLVGGAVANYIGEIEPVPVSQQEFGMIVLTARKLAILVPVSNDLIRRSRPSADTIVRDDTVASMATREDIAFIRDDGTAATPKGLRFQAAAGNLLLETTPVDLDSITQDLARLILALEDKNSPMTTPGWIMHPRTKWFLATQRDGNGNLVFKPEMDTGQLFGFPFGTTTQIPTNLGGGGDESELYFADFAQVLIGETLNLVIDASSDAAWIEGAVTRSAFQEDITLVRVLAEHDLGVRHSESIAVITDLTWLFT